MAGENTVSVSRSTSIGGVTITGGVGKVVCDTEIGISKDIPASTTDHFSLTLTIANVQVMAFACDQTVVLMTNSTSTPNETITLTAGTEILWKVTDPSAAKFFATNLTALYVVNSGLNVAKFRGGFGANTLS